MHSIRRPPTPPGLAALFGFFPLASQPIDAASKSLRRAVDAAE